MASHPPRRRKASAPLQSRSSTGKKTSSVNKHDNPSWRFVIVGIAITVLVGGTCWLYAFTTDREPTLPRSSPPRHARDADSKPKSGEETVRVPAEEATSSDQVSNNSPEERKDEVKVAPIDRDFKHSVLNKLQVSSGITVSGRRVEPHRVALKGAESKKTNVRMYTMEHFFTDQECAGLIAAHDSHMRPNGQPIFCFDTVDTLRRHLAEHDDGKKLRLSERDFTEGTSCLNETMSQKFSTFVRWSSSTSFYPGESKFANEASMRIFEATGLLPEHGGKFQITSYEHDVGYKTHTDCVVGSREKRDRYATILVYLNNVEEGGETVFPKLSVKISPRRGRALVWNSMSSSGVCDATSVHNASVVKRGRKVILQRWYYHHNFASLGKRPPPPDLPERLPNQPVVNCDQFDSGSCRLYDEWFYDHLNDYRQQFNKL